jgi:GNAT superfamily N-acetyltransferase
MPTPFFHRLPLPPLPVAFEDIIPAASTAARVRQRAVYTDLIHQWPHFLNNVVRDRVESRLRPYRQRAWEGHLDPEDFRALLDAFLACKVDFPRDMEAFEAYAMLNCCATLLAQMLFVDNCVKEGIGAVSHPENQDTVTHLMRHLQATYQAHQVPIDASAARFYATYFVVQTLFDTIFVGDEEIVVRDPATGQVHLTPNYDFYTSYLELSNSKLITATDIEKALCYQLTTGWGDGIDVATWNALNQAYYSRSADNFFSAAYDEHLDKMLPQFPYGRVRAAHDIVRAWDGVRPVNYIEIGAGSGAFAVELFLALKHQGKAVARVAYRGVEPSEAMKAIYRQNFLHRTGHAPLDAWEIATAGLEDFLDDVERYLTHEAANVLVFSYAAHHCYRPSLLRLIEDTVLQERVDAIYLLDATAEHGWTKVYYMPLDCRSPEDFRNITLTGRWQSHTLWHEPFKPLEHSAVSRAWCALRRLTPPHSAPAFARGAAPSGQPAGADNPAQRAMHQHAAPVRGSSGA